MTSGLLRDGLPMTAIRLCLAATAGLLVANCANQNVSRSYSSQEKREFGAFSHSKYGRASERVVAEGQEVPKGGGRDLVGKRYSVAGRTYTPFVKSAGHTEIGHSSWYGAAFHGRKTANGEIYDRFALSAAHRTMPLPSYARVTNINNGRSIVVRVNDRGPYHGNRIIDVSQKTADVLDFRSAGTGRVKVEYLGRAALAGSDDRMLLASLRTDGSPAQAPSGVAGPRTEVMVASAPQQTFRPLAAAFSPVAPEPVERSVAPAAAPAVTTIAMAQPTPRAEAPVRVAANLPSRAPLPPERPFDLMTIPNAGTPVMNAVPGAPSAARATGTTVAQLFYAEPDQAAGRFEKSDPWAKLKPQGFQPTRLVR